MVIPEMDQAHQFDNLSFFYYKKCTFFFIIINFLTQIYWTNETRDEETCWYNRVMENLSFFFLKRLSFTCKNQNLAKYVHVQPSVFVFLSKEIWMIFVLCDEIMTDITCQHLEWNEWLSVSLGGR